MRYLEYRKSIVKGQKSYGTCAASSAIFKNKVTEKLNGKQAQRAGGIKLELVILQQRTTLSKL